MGLFKGIIFSAVPLLYSVVKPDSTNMQNDAGEIVDLYIPRKCSSSGSIIGAKDHASVQIAIVDVDDSGRALTTSKMYTVCGEIRKMGESDDSMNRLAMKDGIIPKTFNK